MVVLGILIAALALYQLIKGAINGEVLTIIINVLAATNLGLYFFSKSLSTPIVSGPLRSVRPASVQGADSSSRKR